MTTSKTKIRRSGGKLVADLPFYAMPEVRRQVVSVHVPGDVVQTMNYLTLRTGSVEGGTGRLPVHIPPWLLAQLGIDTTKRISLRLYRHPGFFISHSYHGLLSGRAWIPMAAIQNLKLQPNTTYSFQIRGFTPARDYEREEEVREIRISHLNMEYATNTRAWAIPDITANLMGVSIKPEMLFGWAVDAGYDVFAQWFYEDTPGFISVDFIVSPNDKESAKFIAKNNNIAFRDMTLRNYTATDDLDYGFLAEIRCTHLSCYPRSSYAFSEGYMTLMEGLRITVQNIVNFWFQFRGEGSHIRCAEKKGKIKYEVMGEENTTPVSYGEVHGFPFEYADKYVRILAHNDEYEYFNARLEKDLHGKRFKDGSMLVVDKNGFLWLRH